MAPKKDIQVIIETPKGSRNKYAFNQETPLSKISRAYMQTKKKKLGHLLENI